MTKTVTIEKLIYGGAGLAILDGKACFVEGALPGETVSVRILRSKQKHLEAVVTEVHEVSPDRVAPPCPYYEKCGGCQWQHLNYAAQLQWKQLILEETLQKIGKVENPNVLPTIPSPFVFGWRSRVLIHADGTGKVGFYEPNSHRVVDVERCLIATDSVNRQLDDLRKLLTIPEPLVIPAPCLPAGRKAGIQKKQDFELREDEGSGFAQVNPQQNENLRRLVSEWAGAFPHDFIFEMFCGNGNFSQDLVKIAKKFVGVDLDETAIVQARNLISSPLVGEGEGEGGRCDVQFSYADAAKFFIQYQTDVPVDLLLLDPPRDGCGRVVEGVLKHKPKNILYVSCNPATLARDVKFLKEFADYHLVQSQPIDMFPQSYHIESISLFSKPTR